MKRIALLSFIIGLLGVPIQAQGADQSEELQKLQALQAFQERQAQVAQTLSNIANMRHQMMKAVANSLRAEPEQNAAPPIQYYPAPPTQYAPTNCVPFAQNSDPEAMVRYLTSHPGAHVCPSNAVPHATQNGEAAALAEIQRRLNIGNTLLRFNQTYYGP